jgi:hypothetical protein
MFEQYVNNRCLSNYVLLFCSVFPCVLWTGNMSEIYRPRAIFNLSDPPYLIPLGFESAITTPGDGTYVASYVSG